MPPEEEVLDDVQILDEPANEDEEPKTEAGEAESVEEDKPEEEEERPEETEETEQIFKDRPTIKAIKAEFPEIFNKFPELKDAYFRDAEYKKYFPTVEDAKEAILDNEAFNNLSESALNGDPGAILESIEKTDTKAFELFTASFLPTLYKRNPEAYQTAVVPVFEGLIRELCRSTDENLKATGENVAAFLFGDSAGDIVAGKKTFSKLGELSKEQQRLNAEKESRNATAFREAHTYVTGEINKNLNALILKDFDPNKVFNKFMRAQLAEEVSKRIMQQLGNDASHRSVMQARWKRAKNNGYSDDEKGKIISTFLARAKSLIPVVSDKVRSLAAGKQAKESESKRAALAPAKKETHGGLVSGSGNGKLSSLKKEDLRKMTDAEILALD